MEMIAQEAKRQLRPTPAGKGLGAEKLEMWRQVN
jgi:hypothetical protein